MQEPSIRGRVIRDMIAHVTNDNLIGKKIKSGELRKNLVEPKWKCPDCFTMQQVKMSCFQMEYLCRKSQKGLCHFTASWRRLYWSHAQCLPLFCRFVL